VRVAGLLTASLHLSLPLYLTLSHTHTLLLFFFDARALASLSPPPTSTSLSHTYVSSFVLGHYSPLTSEDDVALVEGDVVKIDLGAQVERQRIHIRIHYHIYTRENTPSLDFNTSAPRTD